MTSEIVCFHKYWNSAFQTPRCPLKEDKAKLTCAILWEKKKTKEVFIPQVSGLKRELHAWESVGRDFTVTDIRKNIRNINLMYHIKKHFIFYLYQDLEHLVILYNICACED